MYAEYRNIGSNKTKGPKHDRQNKNISNKPGETLETSSNFIIFSLFLKKLKACPVVQHKELYKYLYFILFYFNIMSAYTLLLAYAGL